MHYEYRRRNNEDQWRGVLVHRRVGGCRKEVVVFALAMEAKLRENDHKRHWRYLDRRTLSRRLTEEREELRKAFRIGNPDDVLREAADVANFAMMLADYTRRYPKVSHPKITNKEK